MEDTTCSSFLSSSCLEVVSGGFPEAIPADRGKMPALQGDPGVCEGLNGLFGLDLSSRVELSPFSLTMTGKREEEEEEV